MLDRLTLENWENFKLIDVELNPLTVLIGKNDTGKSSFLKALNNKDLHLPPFAVRGFPDKISMRYLQAKGILLIEQPENGVHPSELKNVMEYYRKFTQRIPPIQVVFTTYSPFLLNFVDLETEQVLVFRTAKAGNHTVHPVDRDKISLWENVRGLGETWSHQGDDGLVSHLFDGEMGEGIAEEGNERSELGKNMSKITRCPLEALFTDLVCIDEPISGDCPVHGASCIGECDC